MPIATHKYTSSGVGSNAAAGGGRPARTKSLAERASGSDLSGIVTGRGVSPA